MTEKTPAHPPVQAKHPGRGKVAPHRRSAFQTDEHAKAMKRPPEELHIARHALQPHNHGDKPKTG